MMRVLKFVVCCTFLFQIFLFKSAAPVCAQTPVLPGSIEASILSWNIQMLPDGFSWFSSALRKKQHIRVHWIVEHCLETKYDVVVFQEAFDRNMQRKLRRHLRAVYPWIVKTRIRTGRLTNNGILMMSRIPMRYLDHIIYDRGVHDDRMAAKGCTLVEIEKGGTAFMIAGTHLQAGESQDAFLQREKQFRGIRALIEKHRRDSIAVFVVGDMNTSKSNRTEYDQMLSLIGADDFPLDENEPYTIDGKNYWNDHAQGIQLDYVLLMAGKTKTHIVQQKVLRLKKNYKGKMMDFSDHYAISASVLISNSKHAALDKAD